MQLFYEISLKLQNKKTIVVEKALLWEKSKQNTNYNELIKNGVGCILSSFIQNEGR